MLKELFRPKTSRPEPPAPHQPWKHPEPRPWMHTGDQVTTVAEVEDPAFLFSMYGNRKFRSPNITNRRTVWGEDFRLKYILTALDVRGLRVLELGPYLGYHTLILDKLGASTIVSIEGREKNIAVCEKMKQQYGLNATFVLQDIEALAGGEKPKYSGPFDLVFCLGLLYHVPDPVKVLTWCHSQASSLFLGTHYYEPAERERYESSPFTPGAVFNGYEGAWYQEGGHEDCPSGLSPRSLWPREEALIAMLRAAGYSHVSVLGRDLQNNMPHITLIAD
jgi:hypothetical protein